MMNDVIITFQNIRGYLEHNNFSDYAVNELYKLYGVDSVRRILYAIRKIHLNGEYTEPKAIRYLKRTTDIFQKVFSIPKHERNQKHKQDSESFQISNTNNQTVTAAEPVKGKGQDKKSKSQPKLSRAERARRQWADGEIRGKMVQNMRGAKPGKRGRGKHGNSLSYIDFILLQHRIAPSKYGWLDAFACRYRNPTGPNAWRRDPAVSIVRGCARIRKDLKIYVDIERALREYFQIP